ncbi:hypothetical protein MSAN_01256700 [Mycena sanguinolenta]|uniref:Uncharacterized protein n=1 Tax=Mycena sanguinolenta TaxID=230812 RepID=A0A8H6YIY5_9AGAR|nr:hypothetical protein MSAN_01256700 [Mycena sanguinolenta]
MLDTLSHLGIDAWLQSSEGTKFKFTNPPVVEGNQITAVIEVKRAQKYAVHWSKSQGTPASNAWGTIHRPKGKNRLRPFPETRHMSENDSQTQSWSIPYDLWFCTPQNTSFIILKIQHLRDPPTGLPEWE